MLGPLGAASHAYTTNDWLTTDVYDPQGNTRTNAANVFLYDWANRLTNALLGTTNVAVLYDAEGHRVRKTVTVGAATTTTLYLTDPRSVTGYAQVLEEKTVTGGSTNLTKVYTYGLDLLSQRQVGGNIVSYYGHDGHGSVRLLMDPDGGLTDFYVYDAFGTLLDGYAPTDNHYRFCGKEEDPHLRLVRSRSS